MFVKIDDTAPETGKWLNLQLAFPSSPKITLRHTPAHVNDCMEYNIRFTRV